MTESHLLVPTPNKFVEKLFDFIYVDIQYPQIEDITTMVPCGFKNVSDTIPHLDSYFFIDTRYKISKRKNYSNFRKFTKNWENLNTSNEWNLS